PPLPDAFRLCAVEHNPGDVERALRGVRADVVSAEVCRTPVAELAQRHGGLAAPGEVRDAIGGIEFWPRELLRQNRPEVARVQAVTDLMSFPPETDVLERTPLQPRIDPVGKDPLVGAPELSRSGQHTT